MPPSDTETGKPTPNQVSLDDTSMNQFWIAEVQPGGKLLVAGSPWRRISPESSAGCRYLSATPFSRKDSLFSSRRVGGFRDPLGDVPWRTRGEDPRHVSAMPIQQESSLPCLCSLQQTGAPGHGAQLQTFLDKLDVDNLDNRSDD